MRHPSLVLDAINDVGQGLRPLNFMGAGKNGMTRAIRRANNSPQPCIALRHCCLCCLCRRRCHVTSVHLPLSLSPDKQPALAITNTLALAVGADTVAVSGTAATT